MFDNGLQYLTDSGLETTLVFKDGLELPCFAAFTLLESKEGKQRLRQYFETHLAIARKNNLGFILESPTWRANPDWAAELGMTANDMDRLIRESIRELRLIQQQHSDVHTLISGCVGPRSDGYNPKFLMSAAEAEAYHSVQIEIMASEKVDVISAMTLCYVEEAIGICRAAQQANVPVVISFTLEANGRLRCGMSLADAIATVDKAVEQKPIHYMINCAHPSHFINELTVGTWMQRIGGIRANASTKSHEELDNSTELDEGDPIKLGQEYHQLLDKLSNLSVIGGCCGTDHKHIEAMADACF